MSWNMPDGATAEQYDRYCGYDQADPNPEEPEDYEDDYWEREDEAAPERSAVIRISEEGVAALTERAEEAAPPFGDWVMYSLTDGRVMFLDLGLARKSEDLGVNVRDKLRQIALPILRRNR